MVRGDLGSFIGLEGIQDELENLRDSLLIEQERLRRGASPTPMSLHVALYGARGTGKTEVAKAIAQIYRQVGVLSGPFVSCSARADLVAGYVGQTAIKTQDRGAPSKLRGRTLKLWVRGRCYRSLGEGQDSASTPTPRGKIINHEPGGSSSLDSGGFQSRTTLSAKLTLNMRARVRRGLR